MNIFNREYNENTARRDSFSDYYHTVAWLKRNIGHRIENEVVCNYTSPLELQQFVALRQKYDATRPTVWSQSKFMDKLYYERGENWICFFAVQYNMYTQADLLVILEEDDASSAVLFALDCWDDPRDHTL
jgi:hypothetical protein